MESRFKALQYLPLYKIAQRLNQHYMLIFIDEVRRIRTKNGQLMAFIKGFDGTDNIDIVCFPDTYRKFETVIQSHQMIVINGKFDSNRGKDNYIAETIETVESFMNRIYEEARFIYIREPLPESIILDEGEIQLIYFDRAQHVIGTVSKDKIKELVEYFNPEDIRII